VEVLCCRTGWATLAKSPFDVNMQQSGWAQLRSDDLRGPADHWLG
jgi:hypothetical protein